MLARGSAHAAYDSPDGNRVCVASTSGGLASLLADMAAERDLELPDIAGETEETLLEMEELLTFGEFHNPADIRGYGAEVLPEIAETLFADDSFDAYVFAIGLSGVDDRAKAVASDLQSVAAEADAPVVVLWTGRKEPDDPTERPPYAKLRKHVPVYEDPAKCMDAVASLTDFASGLETRADRPARTDLAELVPSPTLDLPTGRVLTWSEAANLLSAFDVPLVDTQLATSRETAVDAAGEFGYPVVLKIDSPEIPHRTDIGGVAVGVETPEEVRTAYDDIVAAAREVADERDIEGVLVQPMVEEGVEALVGASPDDVFGSLVTVGPGGVLVEAMDDSEVLVPPFSAAEAREAIEETMLDTLLTNRRGGDAIPLDPFVEFLVNVGNLTAAVDDVAELDLNPVMVTENGPVAVDALVRTE
ncbi:acetate--CoA ligase family protein [Halolamina sp.]|uniref:acetate--CoA ligase family protein n=1 Tax=Halolamina sp. TaxID=1940283 RepID=UPI00356ACB3C